MEKSDRLVLVLLVGGVLVMLLWMMRGANLIPGSGEPLPGYGKGPGEIAPPIKAEGWINGEPPTEESLRGKVVVVEAWAHWCVPCLQNAPKLVALYNEFQGEDVVFLGLTAEGKSDLSKIEKFADKAGFRWPNGYGAVETLIQLGGDITPSAWVIGRDGRVTWNKGYEHIQTMKSAIEEALAAPPVVNAPPETGENTAVETDDNAVSSETPSR